MADLTGVSQLKVLDLGTGMPAALYAKFLVELGARVTRIAGDEEAFRAIYPAWDYWRDGVAEAARDELRALIESADVCLVGGEDHPAAPAPFDAIRLAELNPRLIVVDISAYAGLQPHHGAAVELLVQARTGFAAEHAGHEPRASALPFGTYGGVTLALLGTFAALLARERTGRGQFVRTSMQQGLAMLWSQLWLEVEHPDRDTRTVAPPDVRHLIFECAGGDYVHFTMGVPGAVSKVYRVLGIDADVDPRDPGVPSIDRPPEHYYGDRALIAPRVATFQRDELLTALRAEGIAAQAVLQPGACWSDPQVAESGVLREASDGTTFCGSPITFTPHPAGGGRATRTVDGDERALAGITILDFGTFTAGPFASRLLADLGADVIKIDSTSTAVKAITFRNDVASNVGKRRIMVDAKAPEGRALIERLCACADAVHHNFRVGVAERLGLDAATLWQYQPDLVVLESTAFGLRGHKAKDSGFEMVVAAWCGHEIRTGGQGNTPAWYRVPVLDFLAGALGAVAMAVGLYERERSGAAVSAELSLMSTALFAMSELVKHADGRFGGAPPLGGERRGLSPWERFYRTTDGWIAVAARTEQMRTRLLETLGVPQADVETLAKTLGELTTAEATQLLTGAGVWAEACATNGWQTLLADDSRLAGGIVGTTRDPRHGMVTGCLGEFVSITPARQPGVVTQPRAVGLPRPGQHTGEVLAGLGYEPGEIMDLTVRGVIR